MTIQEAIARDLRALEDTYILEIEQDGQGYSDYIDRARTRLFQAVQLRNAYQRANFVFTPYISNPPTQTASTWPPAAPPPPAPPITIRYE